MYSLYRAWLSLGPCNSLPPLPPPLTSNSGGSGSALVPPPPTPPQPQPALNLSPPQQLNGAPDVSLQVGPNMVHFSAHRNVLCAHSGYFKAALSNQTTPGASILVPNINIDEFSSLLTFMYTGYLDLNLGNIYNILLATHILHMPKALEICRNFLMQTQPIDQQQQQQQRNSTTNIIKPIPSRKTILPHQQIYAPIFSNLQKSEETPFKTIKSATTSTNLENINAIPSTSKCMDKNYALQKVSTITTSSSSCSASTTTATRKDLKVINNNKRKHSGVGASEKSSVNNKKSASSSASNQNNDKVIIDIACCDGPVRFYRVINKNYGLMDVDVNADINSQSSQQHQDTINKVMSENIRDKQQIGDENSLSQQQNSSSTSASISNGNDVFTCLYCNHTFKSQYCYQKHARRHLNPVSIEAAKPPKIGEGTGGASSGRREVRLLDMNVQYYPCKTCGSKFPSYYFVHKHRKMCHAEEMADSNNKNNEISAVNSQLISSNNLTANSNEKNKDENKLMNNALNLRQEEQMSLDKMQNQQKTQQQQQNQQNNAFLFKESKEQNVVTAVKSNEEQQQQQRNSIGVAYDLTNHRIRNIMGEKEETAETSQNNRAMSSNNYDDEKSESGSSAIDVEIEVTK